MRQNATFAACVVLVLRVVTLLVLWGRPDDSNVLQVIPGEVVTNAIGMKLRRIEPGSFMMGSKSGDGMPVRRVTITEPFHIGVHEVTQAEYEQVMAKNPARYKGANLPVNTISWDEPEQFCRKLSEMEPERTYRLPTEAEWEYCCRAGSTTDYYWGDEFDKSYAWTEESWGKLLLSRRLRRFAWRYFTPDSQPRPVGSLRPNAWGLFDMSGNVAEWCADWVGHTSSGPTINPTGTPLGVSRIIRGGSWRYGGRSSRSASASINTPDQRRSHVGFRVVCVPSVQSRIPSKATPIEEQRGRERRAGIGKQ